MALNKSQTSLGVKVIIIVLIVAFVASFIPLLGGAFSGGETQNQQASALDAIDQQFAPSVQGLTSLLQSEPESYTVLVNLGNTYFDWAAQLQQASQSGTATAGVDQPMWVAAKDAYRRAIAVKDGDPPVVVDYAITLFYTGETGAAIEAAQRIAEANPKFAPAFFNLGIFHKALAQNAEAVAAFEEYLKLDPEGKQGNPEFAKSEVETLKGAAGTPATAVPTTGTTAP